MTRKKTQLIQEGRYAAEVEVTYIDSDSPWSPVIAKEDVMKTDHVRLALRVGDVKAAAKDAKVYRLTLLAGG